MFDHVSSFSFPPPSWVAAEESYATLFTSASSHLIRDYLMEIQNRREIFFGKKKRLTSKGLRNWKEFSLDCRQIVTSRASAKLKTFCSVIKLFRLLFSFVFFSSSSWPWKWWSWYDTRFTFIGPEVEVLCSCSCRDDFVHPQQIFATAPLSWHFTIASSCEAIKFQLALRLFISLALISFYLHKVVEHHVSSTRITLYKLKAA